MWSCVSVHVFLHILVLKASCLWRRHQFGGCPDGEIPHYVYFHFHLHSDKLYVLTTSDLTVTASLSWEPEASKKTECEGDMTELASYNCRNHIRVHQSIPTVTDDDLLMVCGTQATMTPQCRVVKVTTEGQTMTLQSFTTVDASEGIVSYYPDFSQFGQFRNGQLHNRLMCIKLTDRV